MPEDTTIEHATRGGQYGFPTAATDDDHRREKVLAHINRVMPEHGVEVPADLREARRAGREYALKNMVVVGEGADALLFDPNR